MAQVLVVVMVGRGQDLDLLWIQMYRLVWDTSHSHEAGNTVNSTILWFVGSKKFNLVK